MMAGSTRPADFARRIQGVHPARWTNLDAMPMLHVQRTPLLATSSLDSLADSALLPAAVQISKHFTKD